MSDFAGDIEALVRQVVERVLGGTQPHAARPVLDETAVRQLPPGSTHYVTADTLITPLAREAALERRVQLSVISEQSSVTQPSSLFTDHCSLFTKKIVAIGADHGGYALKEQLKKMLETAESGYTLVDCGTHNTNAVDYPDFAYAVARLVAEGKATCGIIIDGAGIGSCMVANKVPGVRAAMCYDQATAVNSREHNNANVLTLGAGLIGPNLAQQIVKTWLSTEFAGGRHTKRVDKIDQIEKRFTK